ncbi:MAG: A24 family peptidase [Anaerolineales bacterium]|nr:A24 family peptidase [Anaerolineales bacterium]
MITLFINLVLGWIGASLVNYLADVLPTERKITVSRCKECDEPKSWKSLLIANPCEKCGKKPSLRHLAVIILIPILTGLLFLFPLENLDNYSAIVWLLYFSLVTVIDLEYRLILHPVSIAGAMIGLIYGILLHGLLNTVIGGAAGFGIMLIFYFLGDLFVRILSKSRGEDIEEVALGFGDVNLAGVIGLLLGWPGIVGGIFLAILIGGVVSGVFLILQLFRKKYTAYQALPYGPFLVLSTIALLYISSLV